MFLCVCVDCVLFWGLLLVWVCLVVLIVFNIVGLFAG